MEFVSRVSSFSALTTNHTGNVDGWIDSAFAQTLACSLVSDVSGSNVGGQQFAVIVTRIEQKVGAAELNNRQADRSECWLVGVQCKQKDEHCGSVPSNGNLPVLQCCSENFERLRLDTNSFVLVRVLPPTLATLDRVVLSISSDEGIAINMEKVSIDVAKMFHEHRGVARRAQLLRTPTRVRCNGKEIRLMVKFCEPYSQGLICATTKILIVDANNNDITTTRGRPVANVNDGDHEHSDQVDHGYHDHRYHHDHADQGDDNGGCRGHLPPLATPITIPLFLLPGLADILKPPSLELTLNIATLTPVSLCDVGATLAKPVSTTASTNTLMTRNTTAHTGNVTTNAHTTNEHVTLMLPMTMMLKHGLVNGAWVKITSSPAATTQANSNRNTKTNKNVNTNTNTNTIKNKNFIRNTSADTSRLALVANVFAVGGGTHRQTHCGFNSGAVVSNWLWQQLQWRMTHADTYSTTTSTTTNNNHNNNTTTNSNSNDNVNNNSSTTNNDNTIVTTKNGNNNSTNNSNNNHTTTTNNNNNNNNNKTTTTNTNNNTATTNNNKTTTTNNNNKATTDSNTTTTNSNNHNNTITHVDHVKHSKHIKHIDTLFINRTTTPCNATRAWIARVHTPHMSTTLTTSLSQALISTFKIAKVVSVGDVFELLVHSHTSSSNTTLTPVSVFIKIVSLDHKRLPSKTDSGTVICKQTEITSMFIGPQTTLYEVTAVTSPLPPPLPQALLPPRPQAAVTLANIFKAAVWQSHQQRHNHVAAVSRHPTLLIGPRGVGKSFWVEREARALAFHVLTVDCNELKQDTAKNSEKAVRECCDRAHKCRSCVLHLKNFHALVSGTGNSAPSSASSSEAVVIKLANLLADLSARPLQERNVTELSGFPTVLVASTSVSAEEMPNEITECFVHNINMEAPDAAMRVELVKYILSDDGTVDPRVDVADIAKKTAGFVPRDFKILVRQARVVSLQRVQTRWEISQKEASRASSGATMTSDIQESRTSDVSSLGIVLTTQDITQALDVVRGDQARVMGVPSIPNVKWDDVGGLAHAKKDILDTVQLPLEHPELLSAGLRRSGVLLYGPPGTGKTLLAKAVATECSLNFFSVKGPELINMYIGQSEANIRAVFEQARAAKPCVVFFDELDSLAPNRGKSGDSGGVMDRIVSQLLAELDGLHSSNDVFIIAATNRPDLLDPALLRPGRIDKLVFLGLPDKENQARILKALTRKFKLDSDCDIDEVAKRCVDNLTGADLYALSSEAILNSIKRKIKTLQDKTSIEKKVMPSLTPQDTSNNNNNNSNNNNNNNSNEDDTADVKIEVSLADFQLAIDTLSPSVSQQELERYKQIHASFNGTK